MGLRLLFLPSAAVLVHGCSCMHPAPLAADEPLMSPSLRMLRSPVVFAGRVMSMEPVEVVSKDDDRFDCQKNAERCWDVTHWSRCSQMHQAVVNVTDGFKGIKTGEHFIYNCTAASCGDCSPPCPEINSYILDGTSLGGPSRLCGRQTCTLGHPRPWDDCDQRFWDLRRRRPHRNEQLRLPLPLAFALWGDRYRRSDALRALLEDVLQALFDSEMDEVDAFDLFRMDFLQAESSNLTVAEVSFHFATQEEADKVNQLLLNSEGLKLPHLQGLRQLQGHWPSDAKAPRFAAGVTV